MKVLSSFSRAGMFTLKRHVLTDCSHSSDKKAPKKGHTIKYLVTQYWNLISINTESLLTGSADCANDLYDLTNNNESIGNILNNMDTKKSGDDTPMKQKQLFEYETPTKQWNELLRFKDKHTFLSPTTKELQRSIDKAASSTKIIYNTNDLRAARKNILQSVDHILNHELVLKNPQAAAFVSELERKYKR
jgi:hypothetical protein